MLPSVCASPIYATQPHPKCSERYQFISTADIIDRFSGYGFNVSSTQYPRFRKDNLNPGYGTHMVKMERIEEKDGTLGISPQVIIINSHDRTKAFRIGFGFKVWACLNGLITGDFLADSGRLHHTGSGLQEKVDAYLDVHTDNLNSKLNRVRDMRTVFLNDEEITDLIVKAAEIVHPNMQNPYQLLYANREDAMGRDLWTLFNNLQENSLKGNFQIASPTSNKVRKAKPIKNVLRDVETNAKLWNLAESFIPA